MKSDLTINKLKALIKNYKEQARYASTLSPGGRAMASAIRSIVEDLENLIKESTQSQSESPPE